MEEASAAEEEEEAAAATTRSTILETPATVLDNSLALGRESCVPIPSEPIVRLKVVIFF